MPDLGKRDVGRWTEAAGIVCRLLSDDEDDERHQRFVIDTGEQTLLIAHNLDIAERVPVGMGDRVRCRGIYEFNDRGGTLHWTHRDPMGNEEGGWIEHRRRRYG